MQASDIASLSINDILNTSLQVKKAYGITNKGSKKKYDNSNFTTKNKSKKKDKNIKIKYT
ncbi:MAG TPA: hypothetical protein ACYCDB_00035 [Candidatus Azoamicus sp.]